MIATHAGRLGVKRHRIFYGHDKNGANRDRERLKAALRAYPEWSSRRSREDGGNVTRSLSGATIRYITISPLPQGAG